MQYNRIFAFSSRKKKMQSGLGYRGYALCNPEGCLLSGSFIKYNKNRESVNVDARSRDCRVRKKLVNINMRL